MRIHLFIIVVFCTMVAHGPQAIAQLVINEVMSKNVSALADEEGDHPDWIEVFNAGNSAEMINGLSFSTDPDQLGEWEVELEALIEPGNFLVVFCSGKDRPLGPELHSSFKLSNGETIYLSRDGTLLDEFEILSSTNNVSWIRLPDGMNLIERSYKGSPGISNLNAIPFGDPTTSAPPGIYDQDVQLSLDADFGHQIRFTKNCDVPDLSSQIFTVPILISDRSEEPNGHSMIRTNPEAISDQYAWHEPVGSVAKGTVIRYRTFFSGEPSSEIKSASFFVFEEGSEKYSLPVFSVVTDSLSLFDHDSGIYIPGITYEEDPNWNTPWALGNYSLSGFDWERIGHVSLFDDQGMLEYEQRVGMRIHGQGSRQLGQKSLRLYARGRYGDSSFAYPFFGAHSKPDRDVTLLRNMGQDFVTGVPVDVLANQLINDLEVEYMPYKPVVVFINGEFWGIQNLRERMDEDFLANFHSLHKDSVDVIDRFEGVAAAGTDDAYWELFEFIEDYDLSTESNYEIVSQKMEIQNFIDQSLMKVYLSCYDWPGNNVKLWRPREQDSKFRFFMYDSDRCMGDASFNSLPHATEPNSAGWANPPESTLFLRKLLENDGFRGQFISRMDEFLQTRFQPQSVSDTLLKLADLYDSDYPEHQLRWSSVESMEKYDSNYEEKYDFIRTRPCYVRKHFIEFFDLQQTDFIYQCDSSYFVGIPPVIENLNLYPNPNSGEFRVSLGDSGLNKCLIRIFDLNGRLVHEESITNRSIVSPPLGPGMFVVQVNSGSTDKWLKMVVTE